MGGVTDVGLCWIWVVGAAFVLVVALSGTVAGREVRGLGQGVRWLEGREVRGLECRWVRGLEGRTVRRLEGREVRGLEGRGV